MCENCQNCGNCEPESKVLRMTAREATECAIKGEILSNVFGNNGGGVEFLICLNVDGNAVPVYVIYGLDGKMRGIADLMPEPDAEVHFNRHEQAEKDFAVFVDDLKAHLLSDEDSMNTIREGIESGETLYFPAV